MHQDIQRRAYALWEADGCPDGQDQAYWFKAVAELSATAAKKIVPPSAGTTPGKAAAKPARKRAPRGKKAA